MIEVEVESEKAFRLICNKKVKEKHDFLLQLYGEQTQINLLIYGKGTFMTKFIQIFTEICKQVFTTTIYRDLFRNCFPRSTK